MKAHAMPPALEQLIPIVKEIARKELLPRFKSVTCHYKDDGSAVTEADTACNDALQAELASHWPDIPFLSEELPDTHRTALKCPGTVWVADPLDGTNNFAYGIPYFCLSLALVGPDGPELGIVYDPIRDECFSAVKGAGSKLNNKPLCPTEPTPTPGKGILLANLNRLPDSLRTAVYTQPCCSTVRSFGASALDWCWLAAGRGHMSLHSGQNFWDYAAGLLIFTEAGGFSVSFDQQPVFKYSMEKRSVIAAIDINHFEGLKTICC
jgi:myo-inositol-1(or 4)-monophosphatase